MPNPGDEWAAGDIPEEPMVPPDEPTPETLRALGRRVQQADCSRDFAREECDIHATAWAADRTRIEALEKQIGLHPMPDYGDLMTLEEFLVAVKAGGIGDDDGSAYLASALGCTGIQVRPSDVLGGITLGTKFSHIAWFNK